MVIPGFIARSFYLSDVKVTKQKGFCTFERAGYWLRKYRGKQSDMALVSVDNLGNLKKSINTFKCRNPIESMFKDCQTGGYNKR